MKAKKIDKLLEKHNNHKNYCKISRKFHTTSTGFIMDKSEDFVLLQEIDDFRLLGYLIIPIKSITYVRHNEFDKKIQEIVKTEGIRPKAKYKIDLTSWKSICNDLKKTKLTIISESEHPKHNFFCIGRIKKVKNKSLHIRYFNAAGILNQKNTKNKYKDITKLSFDDRYANVFSKYLTKQ